MIEPTEHFDVIAIGAGPFNLGFAALADGLDDLHVAVLEAGEKFVWHPGMMLPGTHLQVPFMADLVTMADPTSKHSFLNYLKEKQRLYPFYIREDFYALREEYSNYLAWAAENIQSVRFGHRVLEAEYHDGVYLLSVLTAAGLTRFTADKLVLGTGSQPYLPPVLTTEAQATGNVVHSSDYAFHREKLLSSRTAGSGPKVTAVLGSGQSAAEIFLDLLRSLPEEDHLVWATRSERYFPLEYTKLTLEMTSPEYIDHFHGLPMDKRDELSAEQKGLYKGINADLINQIHEELYERSITAPATAEGTVTKAVFTERTAPPPGPTTAETAPEPLGAKAARSEEAAMAASTTMAKAARIGIARVETAIDHGVIHVPARPATPAPSAAIGMGKMHILSFKMLHDAF